MPMIKCPECGKSISDRAFKCVHCGIVLKKAAAPVSNTVTVNDQSTPNNVAAVKMNTAVAKNRYETLYESKECLVFDGGPVVVEKQTILMDYADESVYAQVVFRNVSDKKIVALMLDISFTDVWGKKLEGIDNYQYLDLKADRDEAFGDKVLIPVPDKDSRVIELKLKKIRFADRELIEVGEKNVFFEEPVSLNDYFKNDEMVSQYKRNVSAKAMYVPKQVKAIDVIWRCTCGKYNLNKEDNCHYCNSNKNREFDFLNVELICENLKRYKEALNEKLQREREEKLAREQQARERYEREQEKLRLRQEEEKKALEEEQEKIKQEKLKKKKKRKKRAIIILFILILCASGVAAYFFLIPELKYNKAYDYLEKEEYEKAYDLFMEIKDYKNSRVKAEDAKCYIGREIREKRPKIGYVSAYAVDPVNEEQPTMSVYYKDTIKIRASYSESDGRSAEIEYVCSWPDGSVTRGSFDGITEPGYSIILIFECSNPSKNDIGEFKIRFYDKADDALLGEALVQVTD